MSNAFRLLLIGLAFVVFCSHDMFLKLGDYHLPPNTFATIELVNGTFEASENTIDRDRMIDVSLVGHGAREAVDTSKWTEQDLSTLLQFKTGKAGTYVAGVSTAARSIEMEAEAFNGYLEHDGVLDELQWREDNDALGQAAVERYSKHVKTIFQVGDTKTDDYAAVLDYPIEFVPMSNPYDLRIGNKLHVGLLLNGKPLGNQPVLIGNDGGAHGHEHGGEHSHAHEEEGHSHGGEAVRTSPDGTLLVPITKGGTWHLRTIHMAHPEDPGFTHESNWATLTFGVQGGDHTHGEGSHTHADGTSHDHDHEHGGLPGWTWWAVSLALIGGLFFYFRRTN